MLNVDLGWSDMNLIPFPAKMPPLLMHCHKAVVKGYFVEKKENVLLAVEPEFKCALNELVSINYLTTIEVCHKTKRLELLRKEEKEKKFTLPSQNNSREQ